MHFQWTSLRSNGATGRICDSDSKAIGHMTMTWITFYHKFIQYRTTFLKVTSNLFESSAYFRPSHRLFSGMLKTTALPCAGRMKQDWVNWTNCFAMIHCSKHLELLTLNTYSGQQFFFFFLLQHPGVVGDLVPCSRVSPQSWYWGWKRAVPRLKLATFRLQVWLCNH